MKRITGLLAFAAFCVSVGVCPDRENAAEGVSSSARLFVDRPGEAVYVASASDDLSMPEQPFLFEDTVSGNTVSGNAAIGLSTKAGEVFVQVNQARTDIGLSELIWSDELAAAAEVRAREIHRSFSHTRPDGSPWWTADSEIIYGENIAKGYQTADSVVTAWMESSEHKDNILYSGFESIGIAVYHVDGKWYWAQEFGY
ncbi:MAG: CAP domain-containing protein [Blautia sp.]|nr:CAP domain-containing protein [Blautia sp.]MCM1199751.1 CAP domain-containing protein [Bacteroides fragilis]